MMNTNGSTIVIGHPNTASDAKAIMNLKHELRRRGSIYVTGLHVGALARPDASIIRAG